MIPICSLARAVSRCPQPCIYAAPRRHKSIRASIEQGIAETNYKERGRRTVNQGDPFPPRRDNLFRSDQQAPFHPRRDAAFSPRRQGGRVDRPTEQHLGRNEERSSERPTERRSRASNQERSFPYTTAASEFLYGYNVVLAALKAGRRKLYKLYLHEERAMGHRGIAPIMARARRMNRLIIQKVGDEWLPVMDRASSGRPHNGFVLEASPLPRMPIKQLGPYAVDEGYFRVLPDAQSREDFEINGSVSKYSYNTGGWRNPLVLYLDSVLDEGNLGNVIRSAYFLGVDAIVVPKRGSAPMSHITLKASAGAAEAIPIFVVDNPVDFLEQSAKHGWRIYASDAPPVKDEATSLLSSDGHKASETPPSEIIYSHPQSGRILQDHSPLTQNGVILMMGGEGYGLSASLTSRAHCKVGIQAARGVDEVGVDSLNVGVAAGMLCFEMLRKPKTVKNTSEFLF